MKRVAILSVVVLLSAASAGTIDTLWGRPYFGAGTCLNRAADMCVDAHGNVYVCGSGEAIRYPGNTDMLLVKYNPQGDTAWVRDLGSDGWSEDDIAQALAVDSAGNIYVAGILDNQYSGSHPGMGLDFTWLKYDSLGNMVWGKTTYREGDDAAFDVVIGRNQDVYFCGTGYDTLTTLSTYKVARVNPATGDTLWTREFILDTTAFRKVNHRHHARDVQPDFFVDYDLWDNCATAMAPALDSGVIVTGFGQSYDLGREWWTMKFTPSGAIVWDTTYHNPNTVYHDDDVAFDLAVANSGDIYVAGFDYYEDDVNSEGYNYAVVRYSSSGAVLNYQSIDVSSENGDDAAYSVCLDDSTPQNVYVTGYLAYSAPRGDEITTYKFTPDLVSRWGAAGARFGTSEDDHGYKVRYNSGRVYVTGESGLRLVALAYTAANTATKDTLWSWTYHRSPESPEAMGAAVCATDTSHVYVTGQYVRGTSPYQTGMFTGRLFYANRELRLDSILKPVGRLMPGDTVSPRAVVRNAGTDAARFRAYCRVGTRYQDSVAVAAPLSGGASTTITFRTWTADSTGYYAVRCSVATTGDPNLADNFKDTTVSVGSHDVGCLRIIQPVDSVTAGDRILPSAWVRNYGISADSFAVIFRIGDGYSATTGIRVRPGDSAIVSFDNWTAGRGGWWAVTCSTELATDVNPANDEARDSVYVRAHDVGVVRIAAPAGTVDSNSIVMPRAVVRNFGAYTESFRTVILIGASHYETLAVNNLHAGDTAVAPFLTWRDNLRDSVGVASWTTLVGDAWPANDTLHSRFLSRVIDAGADSIAAPADTVDSGTVVTPRVRVRNYGNTSQDVSVVFVIDTAAAGLGPATSGLLSRPLSFAPGLRQRTPLSLSPAGRLPSAYRDSTVVTVPAGSSAFADLSGWLATPPRHFRATSFTRLAGDMHRADDTTRRSFTVRTPPVYDAAVVRILALPDTVDSGTVVTPRAELANYGSAGETFAARMTIGGLYSRDSTVTLAPAGHDTVTFPTWRASAVGVFAVRCSTMLAGDVNPANDTAGRTLVVRRQSHDVGVVRILAVPDTVDSGTVVTPRAELANYGSAGETFAARLTIGGLYSHDSTVTLAPAGHDTVTFPAWRASAVGVFAVRCSTMLAGDVNPANDTAGRTLVVRRPFHDVGVLAVTAPPDTVDTADAITPTAAVKNFGPAPELFYARFTIGASYRDSVRVNLPGFATDTVQFRSWTASPVGTLDIVCWTALAGDVNPANDTAYSTVTVLPLQGLEGTTGGRPRVLTLDRARPSPFTRVTSIRCGLPDDADAVLAIYDATGALVRTLLSGRQAAGWHTVAWDGRDGSGREVAGGVYLCRLTSAGHRSTARMVKLD